jgi:hypothetical protein
MTPLAKEVLEPAWAGHDHVDAATQAVDLRVLAHASEDGQAVDPQRLGQGRHRGVDLVHQLAGGRHDQGAWLAGLARVVAGGQPGEQGKQEGVGLAGARAATAENIATREGVGQRGSLDRGGDGDPGRRKNRGQGSGHAKGGESGVRRHR